MSRASSGEASTGVWQRLRSNRFLRRLTPTRKVPQAGFETAGARLVRKLAAEYETAFFIEIGANDGEQEDHLRSSILRHNWHGIMVEPVPFVFDRLRRNYGHLERVVLENSAIGERDETRDFFHLAPLTEEDRERQQLPRWYDGIGSFSRDFVVKHAREIPDIEDRVVTTTVECLTFESLCRKHAVERIEILVIDAEGYDSEIVKLLDFSQRRPRLLTYEHFHLPLEEQARCRELLRAAGYASMEEGFDTWCLDSKVDDSVADLWDGLEPAVGRLSIHDLPR